MNYPKVEKPTEPGWYWCRVHSPDGKPIWVTRWVQRRKVIKRQRAFGLYIRMNHGGFARVDEMSGAWWGPIPEPME